MVTPASPPARKRADAADVSRLGSCVWLVMAHLLGWGAVVAVVQKWSAEPEDVLALATIGTLVCNLAAIALAVVSLVTGRGKRSPVFAIVMLVLGVLGLGGTAGLFLFFGVAAIGVK